MRNIHAKLRASLLALTLSLTLTGCSEDASQSNSLVSPVPLPDFNYRDTTFYADSSASFLQRIPTNGDVNLLGRFGNYTASLLLQFTPAYFPARDTASVYNALLTLRSVSWTGDSLSTLSFNVYQILVPWSSGTFTWDSLNASFYDGSVARGTCTVPPGPDTQRVAITLDTALVRQWLRTTTSTTTSKYGIILVPTGGNIVRGFDHFSLDTASAPALTIIAGSPAGPQRDTSSYHLGIDTYVADYTQNLLSDPAKLTIQSGIAYRSMVHFDLSFVPRGTMILSAQLSLERDPATTRVSRFTGNEEVSGHVLLSSSSATSYETYPYSRASLQSGTSNTFAMEIRHAVQTWLKGTNYGLLLTAPSGLESGSTNDAERSTLDLYTFYSHRATDPSLRPRLKIIYAVGRQ